MWISVGYLHMMVGTILCKYPNFVKQLPGAGPVALLYIVDCVLWQSSNCLILNCCFIGLLADVKQLIELW